MGSVKDFVVLKAPTDSDMGHGKFNFSNRYSVFDWGEMPDHPMNKGAALCSMTAYFFERLADEAPTHYRGVSGGQTLSQVEAAPTSMNVLLVRQLKPAFVDGRYDYTVFRTERDNLVVPLEVIYRNSLPKGSSVFKRLKEGSLTLGTLGLTETPPEGYRFERPFLDVSTKYESSDRYPDERKGESVRGFFSELTALGDDFNAIEAYMETANRIISEGIARAGLVNEDGKLEFIVNPFGTLMVGDTLGTLDECRFTYKGVDVSKQIPRDWYRYKQPEWAAQIDDAKKRAKTEGTPDWKQFVTLRPDPLPPALLGIMEQFYMSVANAVTGRNFFAAPAVDEIVGDFQRFKQLEMK